MVSTRGTERGYDIQTMCSKEEITWPGVRGVAGVSRWTGYVVKGSYFRSRGKALTRRFSFLNTIFVRYDVLSVLHRCLDKCFYNVVATITSA